MLPLESSATSFLELCALRLLLRDFERGRETGTSAEFAP
jgi:hypothetical protein